MQKKKNGFLILIISVIAIALVIGGMYIFRDEQRKKFDKLIKSDFVLKVEYGIIPRKKVLKEKNSLFKKVDLDNYYYLIITNDNTLFTYYLDWYYAFDPMQGYNLDYKKELTNEEVNNILEKIKSKTVSSLQSRVKDDFVEIMIDNKNVYIDKVELQYILQDNGIMLDIDKKEIY